MRLDLFLLFLSAFAALARCDVVEIEDGLIQGTTMQTRMGVSFHAFLKIPFAAPPLGALRFQAPIRNEKWNGTHDGTSFGPMCVQSVGRYEISENCLHLNVFTKSLPPATARKPVIVFIHGGSFDQGSARNHGPLYLMDRDVVLVTTNYRIGALGFLSTGTAEAVGNMGLKDQVLALQWIQRNIHKFGGDPNSVTITGLSAGGFSVTSHMASEMSRGLFHRVIVMSGSITGHARFESHYLDLARHLASNVNCSTADIAVMISCMQEQPAESFMSIDLNPVKQCPFSMDYYPVIENDFRQERFLSENPLKVFADPEKIPRVQVMIGVTEHEMFYIVPLVLASEQFLTTINQNLASVTYNCFDLEYQPTDVTALRTLYFPYDTIDRRAFNGIGNYFGDGMIGHGSHRLVHMISNHTDVFYYKFTYVGRHSVFNYPRDKPFGMSHADDIQYVLDTWYVAPSINASDPENLMVERMTRMWEQFARTGNPNNSTDEYLSEMNWPTHDSENEYYLEIGQHLVEKHGLSLERFAAWDQLQNSGVTITTALNLLLIIFIFLLIL